MHVVPKLQHAIRCELPEEQSYYRQRNQFKSLSAEAGLPANQIHGMLRIERKALLITVRLALDT